MGVEHGGEVVPGRVGVEVVGRARGVAAGLRGVGGEGAGDVLVGEGLRLVARRRFRGRGRGGGEQGGAAGADRSRQGRARAGGVLVPAVVVLTVPGVLTVSAVLRSGAWLAGARLAGARLSGARLSGAQLSGAWLSGAWLSGAWLPRALLPRALWPDARLPGVRPADSRLRGVRQAGWLPTGTRLAGQQLADAALAGLLLVGLFRLAGSLAAYVRGLERRVGGVLVMGGVGVEEGGRAGEAFRAGGVRVEGRALRLVGLRHELTGGGGPGRHGVGVGDGRGPYGHARRRGGERRWRLPRWRAGDHRLCGPRGGRAVRLRRPSGRLARRVHGPGGRRAVRDVPWVLGRLGAARRMRRPALGGLSVTGLGLPGLGVAGVGVVGLGVAVVDMAGVHVVGRGGDGRDAVGQAEAGPVGPVGVGLLGVGEPVVDRGVVVRDLPRLYAGRRRGVVVRHLPRLYARRHLRLGSVGRRALVGGDDGPRLGVGRLVRVGERRWNVSPVGLAEARRWRRGCCRAVGFPAIVLRPGFLATHRASLAREARSLCRYGRSQAHPASRLGG
ncbi:pentapeptide repeat-containing protein [Nonomuraea zeae]